MDGTGAALRAVREAAGMSAAALARQTHYSSAYISLVENGKRPATPSIVEAYERVLGVGGLGDAVNRRNFLSVTALAASNVKLVTELSASIAGGDVGSLAVTQTTYGVDRAIASVVDRGTYRSLRRWAIDDPDPIVRVNATGILAKVPGQAPSDKVVEVLGRDDDVRDRYLVAVVARVCSLDWATAAGLVEDPSRFRHPALVAERLCREAVNPLDAGARWCSATMLQRLSPLVGR
jgi:transcriptional regulator with XRE-family HTH domain